MADAKERAEHIMLVDLGRNDIGRVSEPGSVRPVPSRLMYIERYSHVMHIVSEVEGRLKDDEDAFRRCGQRFRWGRSAARLKSARWRSLMNWSRCAGTVCRRLRLHQFRRRHGYVHYHPHDDH